MLIPILHDAKADPILAQLLILLALPIIGLIALLIPIIPLYILYILIQDHVQKSNTNRQKVTRQSYHRNLQPRNYYRQKPRP